MNERDVLARLNNVTKIYRRGREEVRALDGVSLNIARGEFVAVLGPSGSGKSTLLHLIGGVDRPTSGEIEVAGMGIHGAAEESLAALRRHTVGFVFQQFFLLPTLTARENVLLPHLFGGRPNDADPLKLLERVGLLGRAGHKPGELSGGEMQRVAIARALANDPAILLADEPTGQLDSSTAAGILDLLGEIHHNGTTVIVVTHNEEIANRATKVVRLRDGRIP